MMRGALARWLRVLADRLEPPRPVEPPYFLHGTSTGSHTPVRFTFGKGPR